MTQDFGMESHGKHKHSPLRAISRYLVVIASGGESVARMFDANRVQVAEFDASTEEVSVMLRGLIPTQVASDSEWDAGLQSHSALERAAAEVYALDL